LAVDAEHPPWWRRPVENGGGEHVVAAILTRFNWNWLKLVQAESACGLRNEVFGVPPLFELMEGFARCPP
jgi:hypothetical protein